MSGEPDWGPSHQTTKKRERVWPAVLLTFVLLCIPAVGKLSHALDDTEVVYVIGAISAAYLIVQPFVARARARSRAAARAAAIRADPSGVIHERARNAGGGVYLGVAGNDSWRFARSERAVLLLGPPRSGKTSGVIIPALIAHDGPAVSTSTKPDVQHATRRARQGGGRVWVFDPTGSTPVGERDGLRWSPVASSVGWDGAMVIARAMTSNIGVGTTDRSHWAKRAQALLAPMLHAAAVHDRPMSDVVEWTIGHDLEPAGVLLEDERCSQLAFTTLLGLNKTEDRELSSIFSAAADALDAYTTDAALHLAQDPNFDPAAFVRSRDTIYIHAPGEQQQLAAPIVCGLLAEIRRATYQAHARQQLPHRVLFALDELANIAPLDELPSIASEGGGQGLALLAAFQDLSQARHRWGPQADGFLTLFGTKLLLPGIADTRTLDAVSVALGEYDRQVVSNTTPNLSLLGGTGNPGRTQTTSTQRTRVLSPGEIAGIPAGKTLHLDGLDWELLTLTPAHTTEPWHSLLTGPATAAPSASKR